MERIGWMEVEKKMPPIRSKENRKNSNLKNSTRQYAIVLFGNLSFISWPVKGRRIIIDVFYMNYYCGIVFIQVVRCYKPQFVLKLVPQSSSKVLSD